MVKATNGRRKRERSVEPERTVAIDAASIFYSISSLDASPRRGVASLTKYPSAEFNDCARRSSKVMPGTGTFAGHGPANGPRPLQRTTRVSGTASSRAISSSRRLVQSNGS
ncbi:hypothetical protein GWI33_014654 [Rhynchophorus ferrugineus]|uniref:Uncharacterized protein n=1 Tax=Rhynchophorus ferrugineus TaxID=354439 RepID=A0A834I6P3_RHYFE|nr:hypothetical protein GWI33_014654 [Rhynchophorus ferrugineus]